MTVCHGSIYGSNLSGRWRKSTNPHKQKTQCFQGTGVLFRKPANTGKHTYILSITICQISWNPHEIRIPFRGSRFHGSIYGSNLETTPLFCLSFKHSGARKGRGWGEVPSRPKKGPGHDSGRRHQGGGTRAMHLEPGTVATWPQQFTYPEKFPRNFSGDPIDPPGKVAGHQ